MKNIAYLTFLVLAVLPVNSFAQESIFVNNKNLDLLKNGAYISIEFTQSFGSYKLNIDYGQKSGFFKNKKAKNEFGKTITFFSKSHAFNVLADKGWVYTNQYDYILGDEEEHKSYLFKKYN